MRLQPPPIWAGALARSAGEPCLLTARAEVLDEERGRIEQEIERTDREIDELVYELYGLTAEERRMVEEEVRR